MIEMMMNDDDESNVNYELVVNKPSKDNNKTVRNATAV